MTDESKGSPDGEIEWTQAETDLLASALKVGSTANADQSPFAMSSNDDVSPTRALRRCSSETIESALQFQATRDPVLLPSLVRSLICRFVPPDLALPRSLTGGVRLAEDLKLDSLTMLELAMLMEETLGITLSDEALRKIHTVDDAVRAATEPLGTERNTGSR